jgi:hypothetical protein
MILWLRHGIIATAREVVQEIVHAPGAFRRKGTFSGIGPERTIVLQSLVSIASKGTFRSKASIAALGAINLTPYNGPCAKGTFSAIRTFPGIGSIDIISTNDRRQLRAMVPGRVNGHEPLPRASPDLDQRAPFATVAMVHRRTIAPM